MLKGYGGSLKVSVSLPLFSSEERHLLVTVQRVLIRNPRLIIEAVVIVKMELEPLVRVAGISFNNKMDVANRAHLVVKVILNANLIVGFVEMLKTSKIDLRDVSFNCI